jgi:hypothetical protein
VLLPYNYPMMQNPQYAADFEALVSMCQERNVAVQTIKSICRRPWGDNTRTRDTWYEPLEVGTDINKAVHWVLGRPGIFLNTVADIRVLPKVLSAAHCYEERPSEEEMEAMVAERQMAPLFT